MFFVPLVLAASIFYHPTPTAKAVWDKYTEIGEVFKARTEERKDVIGGLKDFPKDCVEKYNSEVLKDGGLKEQYVVDLYVIAKYFEMYMDEDASTRFDDKARKFEEESMKLFKELDKCLAEVKSNKKEVKQESSNDEHL